MIPHIEIHLRDGQVRSFELAKDLLTIGRSEQADIHVDDAAITRLHARIERTTEGGWTISDLGSTNGIRFDDRPIRSRVLRNGDVLYLGTLEMVFRDPTGLSDDPLDATVYADRSDGTVAGNGMEAEDSPSTEARASSVPPRSQLTEVVAPKESFRRSDRAQLIAANDPAWAPPARHVDSDGYSDLDGGPESTGAAAPVRLAMLLRFKWTILGTFVLLASAGIPAIWALKAPKYRAVAEVRVRPIIPRFVFETEDNGLIPLYQSYLNTQVSVIRSPIVLQRVLDQAEVQQTVFYKGPSADSSRAVGSLMGRLRRALLREESSDDNPSQAAASPLDALREALEVATKKGTEVIEVAVTMRNPQDAAVIVNAILDQYLGYVRESSEQTDDLLYRKLADEERLLRSEIDGREKVVDRLRKELGTGSPDDLITQMRMRLDEMEARWRVVQKDVALAEWQKNQLQALVGGDPNTLEQPTTQDSAQQHYQDDARWVQLRADVAALQDQIAVEKTRRGDSHPKMIELRERLKLTEKSLREREEQVDKYGPRLRLSLASDEAGPTPAEELHLLRRRLEQLKYEEQLHLKELQKERANLERVFEEARTLAKENEAIRHTRELYDRVRARLQEKTMERNVPGSIDVLARASVPTGPDNDKRLKLTIAALFGAFGAGLGLAFLRARTSQALHEAGDLPPVARAPFLGQLPFVKDVQNLASGDWPAQVEPVRLLRTILLERLPRQKGNVILITGAGKGCGKTTVAVMLAKSLGQCGKKVLLIDTDLRKPSLSEYFEVDQEPGLIGSLTARLPDTQAIIVTDTPGFSVLPAGRAADGIEPELLANGMFETCLDRWRDQYDIILLDTAPVLPVADASILSRHADGTIMVVREGHCRRVEVADAFQDLVSSGANLLGTVFIGSDRRNRYASGNPAYYHAAVS